MKSNIKDMISDINLYEHLPCLIWIVDKQNQIVYYNQKTSIFLENASLSKIVGNDLKSVYTIFKHPNLYEKLNTSDNDDIRSNSIIDFSVNGEATTWEFNITDFTSGKLISAHDITEKIKSQKAFQNLTESLKTVLDNLPSAIFLYRPDGIILDLNNAAEKLTGYNKYELIGKNIFSSSQSFIIEDFVSKIIEKKSKYLIASEPEEISIRCKNDELTEVQFSINPIKISNQDVILASANNVSIFKKYESLLKEVSNKFKILAESIPIGTVIKEESKLYFNQVLIDLIGYSNEEIPSLEDWFIRLYGDNSEKEMQKYEHSKINQFKEPYFTSIRTKKSNEVFIEFIIYKYETVEIWLAYDITERIKTSRILRENEEKFKLLFENAPFGFIVHDESRILDFNKRFCKLLGYTESEVRNKSLSYFEQREEKSKNGSKIEELISSSMNGKNCNALIKLSKKDETVVDADITFIPITINNVRRCQIVVDDLTARKRIEKTQKAIYKISEAAQRSENLHELYSRIHQIVHELMPANNFYIALYYSETDSLVIPYFVDEIDSAPINEPIKMGRGLTEYIIRTEQNLIITPELNRELQESGETDLVGEDSKVWVGVLLKSKGKIIGAMVVQDYANENAYTESDKEILVFVSEQVASAIERKTSEEELKRYNEELEASKKLIENKATELATLNKDLKASQIKLEEMNASKDKFYSIVAHDLKSPFMGLLGLSEVLLQELENITKEETKHYLTQIRNSTKNVFNLVENLLQWSRIQTGRIPLNQISLNLKEEATKVVRLLELNAQKKGIEIVNAVSEDTIINADLNMLSSVLQNLISNSIKFTKQGDKITISSVAKGDFEEIHVKDTGVGLKPDAKDYLFKIDKQYSTMGTMREKGTGLGLLLCKEMINLHKGYIGVNSREGEGADFYFSLPKIS